MITGMIFTLYLWIALSVDDYFMHDRCKLFSRKRT